MIAIVDDDAFVRESLRDLMESLGYNVAAFESSERFLEVACLAETSCVIIDLQMPGFSGLDLQDGLIADGRYIPIIFITGFPDEKFRVRAMRAGAVGFLSKPFNERSLISCLETALNPSIVASKGRSTNVRLNQRIVVSGIRRMPRYSAWGLVSGVPPMDRISAWIDEKPYRFQLMLLAHTAVLCALLISMARF
jgi:FixJ family two-component response regulator